ncbi:OLC1v1020065C1 [Oldenlandia corymbosa var. corymbosa]|uniref:OLC1v1020065C1 n=1 Tax=Oldenlandia corymbosa var. corymbosa TaxID=529605 RepID=A0AAV1EFZ5_OLDCO|nr:OLC1v1020065C1 [Oldenlandia corymbosa var. corymbosa]
MYNGIGLQTSRGSGTTGHIQTNKFSVKPKPNRAAAAADPSPSIIDHVTAREPNKEILEHDRQRQIELKLLILEEKLVDHGYSESQVAEMLRDARIKLEAAASTAGEEEASAASVMASK